MRINQAVIKVVTGTKGNTNFFWWRKSRTNFQTLEQQLFKVDGFYYAKIYRYVQGRKIGTRKTANGKKRPIREKGTTHEQIGYIYWKDGILTTVIN